MQQCVDRMNPENVNHVKSMTSSESPMTWVDMKSGPEKVAWVLALPFAITFCDSAFSYFMKPFGVNITPNALIPVVLLYMGLFLGRDILSISRTYVVWLGVLVLSMSTAVVTAEQVSIHRILEAGKIIARFESVARHWNAAPTPFVWGGDDATRSAS